MGKITLSGEPIRNGVNDDEILMGFDRMTDAEIMYTLDRSPRQYQEYMGGKVQEWLQRRKTRAKAFVQKVGQKYKKLPTWAKVLTAPLAVGAALPLAAAALPAAAVTAGAALPIAAAAAPAAPFAAAALAKKRADAYKKMTPAQKAAADKKRRRRIGVAAALVPGLGLAALTTAGAVKGVKALQKRRKDRLAKRRAARKTNVAYARTKAGAPAPAAIATRAPARMAPVPMKAVPVPPDMEEQATGGPAAAAPAPEQKKGGLGGLLGLGALAALPFLLGTP